MCTIRPSTISSVSLPLSMTLRGSLWLYSLMHLFRACVLPMNSIVSSAIQDVSVRLPETRTELTSVAILKWFQQTLIESYYIAPRKLIHNRFLGSINGSLLNDSLNEIQSRGWRIKGLLSMHGRRTTTGSDRIHLRAISRPKNSP